MLVCSPDATTNSEFWFYDFFDQWDCFDKKVQTNKQTQFKIDLLISEYENSAIKKYIDIHQHKDFFSASDAVSRSVIVMYVRALGRLGHFLGI